MTYGIAVTATADATLAMQKQNLVGSGKRDFSRQLVMTWLGLDRIRAHEYTHTHTHSDTYTHAHIYTHIHTHAHKLGKHS